MYGDVLPPRSVVTAIECFDHQVLLTMKN